MKRLLAGAALAGFCLAGLATPALAASEVPPPVPPMPSVGCICPQVYDPVVGADGKTYSNACEAGCAGVAVAKPVGTDPVAGPPPMAVCSKWKPGPKPKFKHKHKPGPYTIAPKPGPYSVAPKPDPYAVAPKPDPYAVAPKPDPYAVAPKPVLNPYG